MVNKKLYSEGLIIKLQLIQSFKILQIKVLLEGLIDYDKSTRMEGVLDNIDFENFTKQILLKILNPFLSDWIPVIVEDF